MANVLWGSINEFYYLGHCDTLLHELFSYYGTVSGSVKCAIELNVNIHEYPVGLDSKSWDHKLVSIIIVQIYLIHNSKATLD